MAAALLLGGVGAGAQTSPAPAVAPLPALTARAAELVPVLNGGGVLSDTFAPSFLAAVPEPQFRTIAAQLAANLGKAVAVAPVLPAGPATQGTVVVRYEHGSARMALAADSSGKLTGLRVLAVTPDVPQGTMSEVLDALRALPGRTSFALADLGPGAPQLRQGIAPDRPMALGSAFKLVILATLVQEIEAGRRHWTDEVTLDGAELPAGGYNQKPAGTRVSLRELARQMISVSDNSATDILTDTLGRERIEAMQATVGIADPARNRPWLKTMELFKLKGVEGGALGRRYLALGERGRRALLAGEVAHTPGSAIGALFADGRPVSIDRLEWFASPSDLVRVMDWLRRHSESGPGAEARAILAVNPGLPAFAEHYAYVGFKGGSEPGVLTTTFLLRTRGGQWKVLSAGWSNPDAAVDQVRFFGLVTRAGELAAAQP